MRFHHLLASSLALAGLTSAQTQTEFIIYPHTTATSFAYYNSTTVRSEILQEVPGDIFSGIGDKNTNCTITQFNLVTQDEDASTQEAFSYLFRKPLTTGPGPDVTTAGEIARFSGLMTPLGTGRLAWIMTFTLTVPLAIPCDTTFFHGAEIGPFTLGPPANGQLIHGASYTNGTFGDNPRFGAPNLAWTFLLGGTTATSIPNVMRVGVLHTGSVLNLGGLNPSNARQPAGTGNYGAGGIYPDISGNPRSDGLEARVRDVSKIGGPTLLFMSRGRGTTGPITIPGITGRFRLDVLLVLSAGVGAFTSLGEAIIPLAPAGTISPALIGSTIHFQAVAIDSTFAIVNLSNTAAVSF